LLQISWIGKSEAQMHLLIALLLTVIVALSAPSTGAAQLRAELVADGLVKPVAFAQNPADPTMQLVAEHIGVLRILKDGQVLASPFLDISTEVASAGELGLLGVAFAPDYAESGRFFVSFIDRAGNSVVSRFVRSAEDPLAADPASRFDLRWPDGRQYIEQPFSTHKGGDLAFGPDGYLYLGLGDGGDANDPLHMAQNPGSLLGKMLRLDVSVGDDDPEGYDVPGSNPFVGVDGVLPEIWSFGWRNPWRFSFDLPHRGGTGAMLVADVGQVGWEEIDYEPALAGGRNYGWRNREGAHVNIDSEPPFTEALTDPVYEYDRLEGRSITGGYVYRGTALGSAYQGRYFFADFVFGRIISLGLAVDENGEATATGILDHSAELQGSTRGVSAFGVDAAGELYVLSYVAGRVYKIASASSAPVPPSGSGLCLTPDPFAVLGGGVCIGGEWLPPGIAAPTPSAPTPPSPEPTAPAVTCAGTDPFAAMGGGTCVSGEWLPPGHPGIPVTSTPTPTPTPTPAPSPAPTPTSPAPLGSTTCSTPDPFEALGGGVCYNGEWLPPGYPVPTTAPPTSDPAPTSAPAPAPSEPSPTPASGGCTTPDPFEILGGGVCIAGEWLPPGFPTEE
jgi:glucose/arabinose dehydrogenase